MAVIQVSLLVAAVLGVFWRPARIPNWSVPVASAVLLVAVGGIGLEAAADSLHPLLAPLAFLLLAVPLAVLLDRLGFFTSLAALVGRGPHSLLGLWVLAACVTTFLNLDASVVLLTPLYIRIARSRGLDATIVTLQPVLLACLASSALPISNLTNLIVAEQRGIGVLGFVVHLGPASLVAVIVGWLGYRRIAHQSVKSEQIQDPVDPRALRFGTPVVAFVVLGFTLGGAIGIPAWLIALIADVILLAMTRHLDLKDFPLGTAALAGGLAVVATAAAPHLGIGRLIDGSTWLVQLQTAGIAIVGADTINNLPALLVSLPAVRQYHELLWPLLFGVNFGPIFILHGSLAGLLWRNTASRLDVHVSAWEYTKVGLRVGIPALAASLATVIATNELLR